MGKRYWEVDALRGFALLVMIFFHILACMVVYHMIVETPFFLGFYQFFIISTVLFVLIAGVSLVLRHARKKGKTTKTYYLSIAKKACALFGIALMITAVTFIYSKIAMSEPAFVLFGFLHMLSISMIISIPFLRFGKWNFITSAALIIIGLIPAVMNIFPIGVNGAASVMYLFEGMKMIEYFPILPWAGILLLGVSIGAVLYPNGIRRFNLPDCGKIGSFLAKIGNGKVTLIVYIVHIPIIMLILRIVSFITGIGYL